MRDAVCGGILARGDVGIRAGFVERADAVGDLIAFERLAGLNGDICRRFDEDFAAFIDDANGGDGGAGRFDGFWRCSGSGAAGSCVCAGG